MDALYTAVPGHGIVAFNDRSDTTFEDVHAVLDKAIKENTK